MYYYDSNSETMGLWYEDANDLVNLTGVNNVIGRAVIIHAIQDPCNTTCKCLLACACVSTACSGGSRGSVCDRHRKRHRRISRTAQWSAHYPGHQCLSYVQASACWLSVVPHIARTAVSTTASATTALLTTGDQLTTGPQGYDTTSASTVYAVSGVILVLSALTLLSA